MDIRTVPNPLVRAGGRWLHRVNQRHPWSHNDHFHGWILSRLPARRRRALDVGCGAGHASKLLEPGGRLLVVGLARPDTVTDLVWEVASSLLNPLVGMVKHPQPVTEPVDDGGPAMPVRDAAETFAELSRVVRAVLPGARIRRRLFFRYALEWTRPA